jgi:hypothetical protein
MFFAYIIFFDSIGIKIGQTGNTICFSPVCVIGADATPHGSRTQS